MNAPPVPGQEARVRADDHMALKLWLRMLSCTNEIEAEIRRRLRERFDISLARFDYLAQLYRHPDGTKMADLARDLMVTGGSVTALTDELARDGLVVRESSPTDRRSWILRLTPQGRNDFKAMAVEHEQWVIELFDCFNLQALQQLHQDLGTLRAGLNQTA